MFHYAQRRTSVFGAFKPMATLGVLTGDFPVENALFSKDSSRLAFKKCSFTFLWSCLFCIIKLGTTLGIYASMIAIMMVTNAERDRTVFVPINLLGLTVFFFGCILHVVNMSWSGKLVKIFEALDIYDLKYPAGWVKTRLISHGARLSIVTGLLANVMPIYLSWRYFPLIAKLVHKTTGELLRNILNKMYIVFPGFLGMIAVQFSAVFHYSTLFYVSEAVRNRLENFLEIPHEFSRKHATHVCAWAKEGKFLDKRLAWAMTGTYSRASWNHFGGKYFDFLALFKQYSNLVAFPFIILYASLTISLICGVYLVLSESEIEILSDITPQLFGIVLLNFSQIYFLARVGECLKSSYETLLRTISQLYMRMGSSHSLREEKSQLLSVILTYVVVLMQMIRQDTTNKSGMEKNLNSTAWGHFANDSSLI